MTALEGSAEDHRSLAGLVRARAADQPGRAAFRYKARGAWQDVPWSQLAERGERIAAGLRERGVAPDDCVLVAAPASPAWLYAVLGAHMAGALPLTVYQGLGVEDLAALIAEQQPKTVIAELSWLEMLIESGVDLPSMTIVTDERRPAQWFGGPLTTLDDVMVSERPQAPTSDSDQSSPAVAVCTAGTSGGPRAVAHSTQSLVASARALADLGPGRPPLGPKDSAVVEMPTGHLAALVTALVLPVVTGLVSHLPEGRPADAVREVHPTLSINVATAWERTAARIQVVARGTWGLKGAIFRVAQRLRRADFDPRAPVSGPTGLLAHAGYGLVFLPLLGKFGLERLRAAYVVGPTSPDELSLWSGWGVDLTQTYGLAEAGVLVGRVAGWTLQPARGVEVQLRHPDRLAVQTDAICLGYLKGGRLSPASASQGWLDTGDAGMTNPAGQRVLGPVGDIVQHGGRQVPLALVDATLRYSPYVRMAVTSRDPGTGDLDAVLDLDFGSIARWATANGISYRSRTALLESDAVVRLLQEELEQANLRLARQDLAPVRSISVAPARFTAGIEITPVGSVRRLAGSAMRPADPGSATESPAPHSALATGD